MHALPQSYEAFRQEMLSQLNEVFQEICSEQEVKIKSKMNDGVIIKFYFHF